MCIVHSSHITKENVSSTSSQMFSTQMVTYSTIHQFLKMLRLPLLDLVPFNMRKPKCKCSASHSCWLEDLSYLVFGITSWLSAAPHYSTHSNAQPGGWCVSYQEHITEKKIAWHCNGRDLCPLGSDNVDGRVIPDDVMFCIAVIFKH